MRGHLFQWKLTTFQCNIWLLCFGRASWLKRWMEHLQDISLQFWALVSERTRAHSSQGCSQDLSVSRITARFSHWAHTNQHHFGVIPLSFIFSTRFCKNVVVSKQVKNTVAVLVFFNQQEGSVTSSENNWATYSAHKEKDSSPGL